MTRFTDGPARGRQLRLMRSPLFLRVVLDGRKYDALDLLSDEPRHNEEVVVYRLESGGGTMHVCGKGGCEIEANATYVVLPVQPGDAITRNTSAWREWCAEQGEAWKAFRNYLPPPAKEAEIIPFTAP